MKHTARNKKIILTGGGTAGSVSPLLAVFEEFKNQESLQSGGQAGIRNQEFLWIGTKRGVEREMVSKPGIKFKYIVSGKLRRYFSWQNFIDPFKIVIGFFQSIFIILRFRPDLVMSAGGFVSVPVVWAAWLLRVRILIHQQDIRPGLANKLMAPFADVITVTFEKSLADYGQKAEWVGNPVRRGLTENRKQKTENSFGFSKNSPVVLIVGGGTGAMAINELVWGGLDELMKFCQVVHICGKNKHPNYQPPTANYQYFEFLEAERMAEALQVADVVVSRGGLNLLTELSYLGKPSILIPIPDSHQEDNAKLFRDKKAAVVLNQKELTKEEFVKNIKKLLQNEKLKRELSESMGKVMKREVNEKIVETIKKLINTN